MAGQTTAARTSLLLPVLVSMAVKLGTAPLVAVSWLVLTRVALGDLGVDKFAVFSIAVSLAVILPFADLGLGAAVMDAASRKRGDLDRVVVTTVRYLLLMGSALVGFGVCVAALGGFSAVLDVQTRAEVEVAFVVALALFAAGLTGGLTTRLLTGGGRNTLAVALQALPAPLSLGLVLLARELGAGVVVYAAAPFLATLVVNAAFLPMALDRVGLRPRTILASVLDMNLGNVSVRGVAGPMLIITVVLPIAYQLDRVFLSRRSTAEAVAEYSVAYQVYAPLIAALGAGAVALWPLFAKERDHGELTWGRFRRALGAFLLMGATMGAGLALVGPFLGTWIAGETLSVSSAVFWCFGALVLLQAVSYPMAMLLTTHEDLKIQAWLHVAMLAVNLPLTVWLAGRMGAPGPVLASVAAVGMCMLVPQLWLSRRAMLSR